MRYVFVLALLAVAGSGGFLAFALGMQWLDDMTHTARVVPGERVFVMPAGVVPRGGDFIVPKEQRDVAARQPNPIRATADSVAVGKDRFAIFCLPCHGPQAKGGVTGPVATKFIPPPDLTNAELQRQRTDGYWHSYIVTGGAVMPSYGEALSSQEAWHIVNYLRTLAAR
jgi:mono/diheme cytochrome c family protein